MLQHWDPVSVMIVASFLLPSLTSGFVAILSAWRGNNAAAQQAMAQQQMLLQHDQQIQDLAKQIAPAPAQPTQKPAA